MGQFRFNVFGAVRSCAAATFLVLEWASVYGASAQPGFSVLAVCSGGSEAALVQGSDGNFYGTTFYGGPNDNGTVFKVTPSGAFTTLGPLGLSGGSFPRGGLLQ